MMQTIKKKYECDYCYLKKIDVIEIKYLGMIWSHPCNCNSKSFLENQKFKNKGDIKIKWRLTK